MKNIDVFRMGFEKVLKPLAFQQQKKLFDNFAFALLREAVESWDYDNDYHNMTGNTRYSFISAVYYKQKKLSVFVPQDVIGASPTAERGDMPSAGYSFPGDRIWFYNGNATMGELGEADPNGDHADEITKGVVKRYRGGLKFQKAPKGGSGMQDANSLINHLARYTNPDGFEAIIAVGVPYAEWLQNERKLDVLTSAYLNAQTIADGQLSSIQTMN